LGGAIKGFKKSMADDEPAKELDEQSDSTADKKDQ
ncbi:MAG: twin-arginine translocase subunit TatA, partial [Cellvibrionales bacterium]|nr:twin-arginine translocase subunit TatA [Cellvibrionales bacterium]